MNGMISKTENGGLILCTNFVQMTSAIIITNRNSIKVVI